MAGYFILQAKNQELKENQNRNFSPSKPKAGWQMISKAIFNQQAPQHKIFKENLKKFTNDEHTLSHREFGKDKSLDESLDKENMYGDHKQKRLNQYFQKVKNRIDDLNEMKAQLRNIRRESKQFDELLQHEKHQLKQDTQLEPLQPTTKQIIIDSDSDLSEDEERKEKQRKEKERIDQMVQRFYSSTTRSFEGKKLSMSTSIPRDPSTLHPSTQRAALIKKLKSRSQRVIIRESHNQSAAQAKIQRQQLEVIPEHASKCTTKNLIPPRSQQQKERQSQERPLSHQDVRIKPKVPRRVSFQRHGMAAPLFR